MFVGPWLHLWKYKLFPNGDLSYRNQFIDLLWSYLSNWTLYFFLILIERYRNFTLYLTENQQYPSLLASIEEFKWKF